MILVLLFGYLIFSNGLLLDMNFNKQIKILNNKIRGHKINSNKEVLKFANGKMNKIEVSKFANKCLYLNKEYSLIRLCKFLESNEEGKKVILSNFSELNLSNRFGFNEIDILRKNGFVIIYSKRGEVLGGLVSIKMGKGEVVIGYMLKDKDTISFRLNEENVVNKNYYFSNLLIKRISKIDEKDYYLNSYIIERYLKEELKKKLNSGTIKYEIENDNFLKFLETLKECDYSYSLEKLAEVYNENLNTDVLDIRILNDLDIYLSK